MYPQQVSINEKTLQQLGATFESAYKTIYSEIATATDFGVANRKQILAQVDAILEDLGIETQKELQKELEAQYKIGADQAVKQLKNTGAPVNVGSGFNTVHKLAIAGLVDDASRAFGESMTGVSRSAQLLLGRINREALTQQIAKGMISGEARKTTTKIIKGILQEQGLTALIDKGGHSWTLDRYADMLWRTKSTEARNRGLINRMVENKYDLVQVSAHGATDACGRWEGQILSMTGSSMGYPTVNQAEADGLFHPNCKHVVNVIIPSLAKDLVAYDPEKQEYRKQYPDLMKSMVDRSDKTILKEGAKYQEVFKKKVETIAEKTAATVMVGPVKLNPRVGEKILNDYNGQIYAMKDVNRSVILVSDPTDKIKMAQLIANTEKEFGKLAAQDIKKGIDLQGTYAADKLSVKTPYGAKAEIQLTTPEMWEAKTKLDGDKMYGEWRKPETTAKRKEYLFNEMRKLYDEANRKTLARLGKL